MMRKSTITIRLLLSLALSTALAACSEETVQGYAETGEALCPGFSMGTRAGAAGSPAHGDAYTLVSYRLGGTSTSEADKFQIRNVYQHGYYAYDDGVLSGRTPGTLVPVAVKVPTATNSAPYYIPSSGIAPLVINQSSAQKLSGVPVSGDDPANKQGWYRTAVIYPAIPMYDATAFGLGFLAVFNLTDNVYASMPDDADGLGTPFEIVVTANGQVHPLPDPTNLYPVKSAVKVWFYSEYYADNDPLTPKEQDFEITSLKLYNVGSNGWYNARTGVVYPNYNYQSTWRTVYSVVDVGTAIANYTNLLPAVAADNVTAGPGSAGHLIRYSAETPVFPSDYRGSEGGGLAQVQPLSLALELKIGSTASKATVPIAMRIEKNKRYHFFINVMSEQIAVSYAVSPWEINGGSGGIGGYTEEYMSVALQYQPGGWTAGGGGSDDIGGN